MNSSALDFSIGFLLNSSPADLTFQDTTDYTGQGITASKVKGNLRLTSPVNVFYINTGYVAYDFTSPDINGGSSFIKSAIPLPLSSGQVLCGNYRFEYRVKVEYAYDTIGLDQSTKLIRVDGVLNTINQGDKIEIKGGTANDGIYTVVSVSLGSTFTGVYVAEAIPAVWDGDEVVDVIYETYKTVDYCFITPTVEIEVTSDCLTSVLTSVDLTDYKVNGISPLITRTHTLVYPIDPSTGSPISSNITGSGATLTAGANIYTRVWTSIVSSVLSYSLQTWFAVVATVQGQEYHDVKCSLCMCSFFNCYKAVYEKYKAALGAGVGSSTAERLNAILTRIVSLYQLYMLAIQCGYSTDYYCTEIKTILNTENCTCDTEAGDDVPVEVIPISGSGGSTTVIGSVWFSGAGAPSSSLGSNNDFYLDTAAPNNIYKKVTGAWVLQMSIQGAPGATGTGVAGQDGVALLYSNPLGAASTATALEEVIDSYTLVANSLAVGEMIEIDINVLLYASGLSSPPYPYHYYKVKFGGISGLLLNASILNYFASAQTDGQIALKITLTKITDTSATVGIYHNAAHNYPNVIIQQFVSVALDFTIDNDIVFTTTNGNAVPAAGDILLKQMSIKQYKL